MPRLSVAVCVCACLDAFGCLARVREFEKWSAEATTNHITRGIYSVLAHGLRPSQRLVRLLIIAHRASIERSDSFWPKRRHCVLGCEVHLYENFCPHPFDGWRLVFTCLSYFTATTVTNGLGGLCNLLQALPLILSILITSQRSMSIAGSFMSLWFG